MKSKHHRVGLGSWHVVVFTHEELTTSNDNKFIARSDTGARVRKFIVKIPWFVFRYDNRDIPEAQETVTSFRYVGR